MPTCPQRPCAVGAQDLSLKNMLITKAPLYSALLLLSLTSFSSAKNIEVNIEAAHREIFIGESVRLTIKVSDFEEGMEPDLSGIKDCAVNFRGAGSQSFQSITIINGKRQATGFSGRNFSYDITPEKPGRLSLGPINVTRNSESTTLSGPEIVVKAIEKQNHVLLFIEPSKKNVIVDEPFSVNLRILIKALPNPYSKAPPITFENPPRIQIPYIKKNNYEGLQEPDIEKILQAIVINERHTPGFAINDFTFDSFFNNSLARFNFKSKQISKNGAVYFEYIFPLDYIPTTEGNYSFGPVSFKGKVYVGATSQGKGITKSIYAIAELQSVYVVPPPQEGRPASYIGAIGTKLSAKAQLDSQTCKVGDPLTLSLVISGDIQLDNINPPALNQQDNLKNNFRIYDDSVRSETEKGQRTYKYTVRPTQAGTLEFPPIEISYYDPDSKNYKTIFTNPIPIRANPATEFKESTVIDTSDQSVTIIAAKKDPNLSVTAPISMKPISLDTTIFLPKLHIPLLLLGPFLFIVAAILQTSKKIMPAAARQQRQRTAASSTIQRIQSATSHQEIVASLREYLSMRLEVKSAALTPSEISSTLSMHNISTNSSQYFADVIEYNFNAGFQTGSQSKSEIKNAADDAYKLIKTVEKELRRVPHKSRSISHTSATIIAFIALINLANTASGIPARNMEFESQLAITQLLTANTPAQFDSAANSFKRVIDNGIHNAPLFYNYGTALLMADQPQAALNAFIRSERYSGTTWELKRNMLLAISKIDEEITTPTLQWYRIPLFWHYGLAARTRLTIASMAFMFIWLSFLMRKTKFKATLLSIAVTLLIIFGSSTATTLYQEYSPAKITPPDSKLLLEVNNEN